MAVSVINITVIVLRIYRPEYKWKRSHIDFTTSTFFPYKLLSGTFCLFCKLFPIEQRIINRHQSSVWQTRRTAGAYLNSRTEEIADQSMWCPENGIKTSK